MAPSDANVFLAPCDPGNFGRTVRSAVDLTEYPDRPEMFNGSDEVRFWGARDGSRNRSYFEKMSSGDLVLFYQDGIYVAAGLIGTTFEDDDAWASTTFWEDAPAQFLYTVEDLTEITVPRTALNRIFDYDGSYTPQGLTRVADGRVTKEPAVIKHAVEKYSQKNA